MPVSQPAGYLVPLLGERVREAGEALEALGSDTAHQSLRPLHDLQRWCSKMIAQGAADQDSVVPIYLLSQMLTDALDNLAGDFRYGAEVHTLKMKFFQTLGSDLAEAGRRGFEHPDAWFTSIQHSLGEYIETLEQINQVVEGELLSRIGDGE